MVKRVVWTETALKDNYKIYKFWTKRNKSKTFSKKLALLFEQKINLLASFPKIGLETDYKNIHIKFISNYSIFYKIESEQLIVLRIFDSSQDPIIIKPY
ncbi:hypothetical protein A5893_06895 [Pedobacter psychrophilus]|uniref:Plasmid stabilization protein n=1 Tax=Pedobacter psychrophilus TaxID=1826909 RepID=A0A179DI16_9SPHI|nr:hypothetical protein A5893_06895 [Pedobacter psychrophilus]